MSRYEVTSALVLLAGCATTPATGVAPTPTRAGHTAAPAVAPAPDSSIEVRHTPDPGFLEQFVTTDSFRRGTLRSIEITSDGAEILYLRSGANRLAADLYAFDTATGTERVVAKARELLADKSELPPEEKARRERQRIQVAGITHYQRSKDDSLLLLSVGPKLFTIARATGTTTELPGREVGYPIDPQLSPDGTKVAVVRNSDLYIVDLKRNNQRRITHGGGGNITNALAEFVAQEEMDRTHGYWWSPDSRHLVYQRTDTSAVQRLRIADPSHPEQKPESWPYPRAGTPNAEVRLGVISATGGTTTWIKWDRQTYPYLNKVVWSENAPLTLLVCNRKQTEQQLLAVRPKTGATTLLLEEQDDAWLNLDPDMPRWLPDGSGFLWTSEQGGSWQLQLRTRTGAFDRPLTPVEFPYRGLVHLDSTEQWITGSALDDPTQQQVYRLTWQRDDPTLEVTATQLTSAPGIHKLVAADNGSVYVDDYDLLDGSFGFTVHRRDGTMIGELPTTIARPSWLPNLELTSVQVADRVHYASLVRPRTFTSGERLPVIVSVYGGPHFQNVTAAARSYFEDQWIADHGFIVVRIDGRGTPHRGRAWERAILLNLGTVPITDQVGVLKALGERFTELDLDHVGAWGWSYGGYLAARAVLQHPAVFHAAVAGAPVTDWRNYDTFYTERYMRLPDDHKADYERASLLPYAKQLARPLLLIHGTADDNVFLLHSLQLSDALTRAGRPHEFLPLVGFTHSVRHPAVRAHMLTRVMEFFQRELAGQ